MATATVKNPAELDLVDLPVNIPVSFGDDKAAAAESRQFSSGSLGWYLGGKGEIAGHRVQITCSIVIIGSKPKAAKKTG